ncbi:MAG: ABC transporter substrate-binding protein [Candidatus Njordarchaeia archaeon]
MNKNTLIGIIIIVVLVAAGGAYYLMFQPTPKKTMLVIDIARDKTTWDPSYSFSVENAYLANMYETLLRIKPDETVEYVLATSYSVSSDGLVWTFNLRQGVKFHDGTPFNATAVKYSIERHKRVYDTTGQGAGYLWWMLDNITIVDTYTVKFYLTTPVPLDTILASIYGAWIISPSLQKLGNDTQIKAWFEEGHSAGTGPYMLKPENYVKQDHVLLERFDDYWGEWKAGQFEKVYFKYTPNSVTQYNDLIGGSADIIMNVPTGNIPTLKNDSRFVVDIEQSVYNYFMFFNTLKYPLNITKVRQALSYATPYQDIIAALDGYARQAKGPVPYGLWPHDENLFQYTYNITKAQELLNEAGVDPHGIKLRLTYAAENTAEASYAPIIEQALEQLGFQVDVVALPWATQWTEAMQNHTSYDLFLLLWWPTYPNGYDNMENMFASWVLKWSWHFNFAWYSNSTFDYYLWTAYTTEPINKTKAFELYSIAQTILVQDAPAAFLYDAQEIITYNAKVKGFEYNINYPGVVFLYKLYWGPASQSQALQIGFSPILGILPLFLIDRKEE